LEDGPYRLTETPPTRFSEEPDFEDLLRAVEEVGGLKALEPYSFGVNLFLLMQLLGAILFVIMVLQLISTLINLWAAINLELGSRLPWL
jgi:hypothetical protein